MGLIAARIASRATAASNGRRCGAEPPRIDPLSRAGAGEGLWVLSVRQRWYLSQGLAALLVLAFAWWLWGNLSANLERRSLGLGFDFLAARASFEMGDNLLGYRAGETFLRAFLAGLVNTLLVALLGIALTFVVGLGVALARLARNPLVSRAAWLYIELARNTPLLLQLLFWHQFIVRILPGPRQAIALPGGMFLSNRGLVLPVPTSFDWPWALGAVVVALAAWRALRGRGGVVLGPLAGIALFALLATPTAWDMPALRGFNFRGGGTIVVEFFALLWALVFYQGAFAAETIRSGILGVPRGVEEAAVSLGLRPPARLRFITLPLALRIAIPPLASQAMSLTKNSSLAVAIGYPDLVRVSTVTISETGRAVECIVLILLIYLSLSLATAGMMNIWNFKMAGRGA
jgi:general L-amino acid transport system permease protein